MSDRFVPVKDAGELDELFARSQDEPVLLFKHDPVCPISARAHRQLQQMEAPVPLVDVANNKDLAQDVTERTGVQHASPQVLVLRNGTAVWSASLHDITSDAVQQAVAQHSHS